MRLNEESTLEMSSLSLARKERKVSLRIPITHLNTSSIFEAHNGQLGTVIKLEGLASDTTSSQRLNAARTAWHHALTMLDENFSVYSYTIRRKLNIELNGTFDNDFCRELDEKYHKKFNTCQCYANELYIVLIYKGMDSGKLGRTKSIFQKVSFKAIKSCRSRWREEGMAKLSSAAQHLMASLARFSPKRLGEHDELAGHSELMAFLGMLVNGGLYLPFKPTKTFPMQSAGISDFSKMKALYPNGHLGQYLTARRISFGRYIALEAENGKTRYSAILTIKRYPESTASVICDPLLHLNAEFIATHSFAIEPQSTSTDKVQKHYNKLINSNDKAISQREQLEECVDGLALSLIHI